MNRFINGETFQLEEKETQVKSAVTEEEQVEVDKSELKSQHTWLIDYKTNQFINLQND